jgi:hypothetical protein
VADILNFADSGHQTAHVRCKVSIDFIEGDNVERINNPSHGNTAGIVLVMV